MSYKEERFSSETLEQVAQRDGAYPISKSVQGMLDRAGSNLI